MGASQGRFESEVYFAVIPAHQCRGFGTYLKNLRAIRKLGLSLGYAYFHIRQTTPRSSTVYVYQNPHKPMSRWKRLIFIFNSLINRYYYRDAFDFIGLNQFFLGKTPQAENDLYKEFKKVNLALSDAFLKENNISGLEELQRQILKIASESKEPGRPLLLNFSWVYPSNNLDEVIRLIPDSIDNLDFRTIYFQHGGGRPRKSGFPECSLRTLVHIRLGDRVPIKTPWGTWLHYAVASSQPKTDGHHGWREHHDESEFYSLTIPDFYRFTQSLISHYGDQKFGVKFFSDGFDRSLMDIYSNNNTVRRLSPGEIKLLHQNRRRYQREFKILKNIPNSTCSIGEKPAGLFKLIRACIETDLIIVGFPIQHNLVWSLVETYTTAETMPVVIFLYKPGMESSIETFIRQHEPKVTEKMIPVNIASPDFSRLTEHLII